MNDDHTIIVRFMIALYRCRIIEHNWSFQTSLTGHAYVQIHPKALL